MLVKADNVHYLYVMFPQETILFPCCCLTLNNVIGNMFLRLLSNFRILLIKFTKSMLFFFFSIIVGTVEKCSVGGVLKDSVLYRLTILRTESLSVKHATKVYKETSEASILDGYLNQLMP